MTLYFKKQGNDYVTEDGMKVDLALISAYPHEFLNSENGWVNIPTSIVTNGEVKIVGMHVATPTKPNNGLSIPATTDHRPHVQLPGAFLRKAPGEYELNGKVLNDKQLTEIGMQNSFVAPINESEELTDLDELSIFEKELFVPTYLVLTAILGLEPRSNMNGSVHRWYHPSFGDDRPDNWLLFDQDTDDLKSLIPKLFRQGAALGTKVLKLHIKAAIEQH